jgi:ABC-type branched-subunit amino acid transport system substrate-binding protein
MVAEAGTMIRRRTWLAGSLAVATVALAGCAVSGGPGPGVASVESGPLGESSGTEGAPVRRAPAVKVAMILPLSGAGQPAAIAKGMKQAGELALFDRDDGRFELAVLDDKGTAEGARAAAEQAVKDGAELILGPLFSSSVQAAAGPATAARVPMIAFTNDRQVARPGVNVMGLLVESEVERVVAFAVSQGRQRIAAFVPDDAYGHLAEAAFKSAMQRSNGQIVALQRYPRSPNAMLEPARQFGMALKELEAGGQGADALFLPGDPDLLTQLASLVTYAEIPTANLKILGTGAMDQPGFGRQKFYLGAWFAGPDPKAWRQFSDQFAKTFGAAPPRVASLAYDAVGLAISLASGPSGQRYTPETLGRPSGFPGVDGTLTFSGSGVPSRSLAVLEVKDFGTVVVDSPSGSAAMPTAMTSTGFQLN